MYGLLRFIRCGICGLAAGHAVSRRLGTRSRGGWSRGHAAAGRAVTRRLVTRSRGGWSRGHAEAGRAVMRRQVTRSRGGWSRGHAEAGHAVTRRLVARSRGGWSRGHAATGHAVTRRLVARSRVGWSRSHSAADHAVTRRLATRSRGGLSEAYVRGGSVSWLKRRRVRSWVLTWVAGKPGSLWSGADRFGPMRFRLRASRMCTTGSAVCAPRVQAEFKTLTRRRQALESGGRRFST